MTATPPPSDNPVDDAAAATAAADAATAAADAAESEDYSPAVVGRLRDEAARYRQEAARYSSAFEGYDESERDIWLALPQAYREDPAAVGKWMQEQAAILLAEDNDEDDDGDIPEYVTPDQLEEALSQTQQQAVLDAQVQAVYRQAEEMGYEPGTTDYMNLLWLASEKTEGDLGKAHEMIEADRQRIIDAYLQEKTQTAAGSIARTPSGAAPSAENAPTDWRAARAAAVERINASQ